MGMGCHNKHAVMGSTPPLLAVVISVACLFGLFGIGRCSQRCPVDEAVLEVLARERPQTVMLYLGTPPTGPTGLPEGCEASRFKAPIDGSLEGPCSPCLSGPFLRKASKATSVLVYNANGANGGNMTPPVPEGHYCRQSQRLGVNVVLLAGSLADIKAAVETLRKDDAARSRHFCDWWHHRTRFIVVVQASAGASAGAEVAETLQALVLLWKHDMVYSLALLRLGDGSVEMSAVFPFHDVHREENVCGHVTPSTALERVATWRSSGVRLEPGRSLFGDRIPRDLGGCRMSVTSRYRATSFLQTAMAPRGASLEMWAAVSKLLNVREAGAVRLDPYGVDLDSNGRWGGALGEVENGTADLCIGEVHIHRERLWKFDMTTMVAYQKLRMWIKKPGSVRSVSVPYLNLPRDAQSLLLLLLAMAVAVLVLQVPEDRDAGGGRGGCGPRAWLRELWALLTVLLEQPVPADAATRVSGQAVIACFLSLTFFLNSAVKSEVVASLSQPTPQHRVASLAELDTLDYFNVGAMYQFPESVIQDARLDPTLYSVARRLQPSCARNFTACLALMRSEGQHWAVIATEEKMAEANMEHGGTAFCYAVPGVLTGQLLSWFIRPGHPLLERMNEALLRLWAAGILSLWHGQAVEVTALSRRRMSESQRRAREDGEDHAEDKDDDTLDWSDLATVFVLLVVGHTVAILVFVVEVTSATRSFAASAVRKLFRRDDARRSK